MTMLFGDTLDCVPISKPGANANSIVLPQNIIDAVFRSFTIATEGTYHHAYTDAGAVSERELVLAAGSSSAQKLYLTAANPTATHVLSAAVKFGRDPFWGSSSAKQGIQHCLAGWNAACTGAVGTITDNPSLLTVNEAGDLKIGAVTAVGVLPYDTYAYLEIEIIPGTTTINVYVNKSLVLTTNVGPASVTQLGWIAACNSGDSAIRVDDICILDSTGTTWNARSLDILSFTRTALLASVGTPAFSPINAGSTLAAVNKNTLSDTSYARSGAADDVGDLYTLDGSNLTDSQAVQAVILQAFARKTALTPRALDMTISDGTNTLNRSFGSLDVTFKGPLTQAVFDKQPDGVTDWTVAAAKALQVGYTVRSGA